MQHTGEQGAVTVGSNSGHRVGGAGVGVDSGSICSPNPCGQDAVCNAGSDRSGKTRPVCTCR